MSSFAINPQVVTPLDLTILPSVLWNRAFRSAVAEDPSAQSVAIGIAAGNRVVAKVETKILGAGTAGAEDNGRYIERLAKSLLWVHGGSRIIVGGSDEIAADLSRQYSADGERAFDADLLGNQIYLEAFQIDSVSLEAMPEICNEGEDSVGRHVDGCRIGFDLGGSDRKAAAVIDGEVVFSEEIEWNPYFESDPQYHFKGIVDSLKRAAAHLPRVDAIGGSAAGVYVANEVRAASLFRGVSKAEFPSKVRRIFFDVMAEMGWAEKPWKVVNDGEVTALAGSMSIGGNSLLGLSMGTSFAAGYVTPSGSLSTGLNELAFVPVDHRLDGPVDEWSGDVGCGVQFFSQQGVARLAGLAGIEFDADVPFPERLKEVQRLMKEGDPRAVNIYQTIGINFGYTIAQFSELYALEHLLILGRVTSGEGGEMILEFARKVLDTEFPDLSSSIQFHIPDEKQKRHGQAVAAASLAAIV